jgi:VWFA-related protein
MKGSSVVIAAVLVSAAPAAEQRQTLTTTATAILVDVVVRDKHGRPVADLGAGDFQVLEDGVVQTVDSFTRVSHGGGIGVGVAWRSPSKTVAVTPGVETPANAATTPADEATTALVFDHLSAESLGLAQRATLAYVPMTGESGVRVGVFATDPGVRVVQSYTTDRALVRSGISHVVPSGTSAEESVAERTDDLITRRRELNAQGDAANMTAALATGAALASTTADIAQRETERALIQTELNLIQSTERFDREHRGYDTSLALLGVVQTLAAYPGRKSIVFFSEGLPVSPVLAAKLDHVIDAANRANVTAYVVDAKGLRTRSTAANTRKEIDTFAEERIRQIETGSQRTEQPLSMGFERVEDTMRLDSRSGLARLAEETGGFLVEQSNDLGSAFRRIDEDNRFHYLLTYSPKNTAFDGKFRAIQVKVKRPGAQVFARKGYRATHVAPGIDAGSYETPALALLDSSPLPNAFPVHGAGFSFPDPARPGLTPVIVQVATSSLLFNVDRVRSTYSAQAAVVVRIRDADGHAAQTVSQQYLLTGDSKDLEAAKKGEILFYREPDLAPGVYTLETIVFDANAQQGSARTSTLTVPAADPSAFTMSSLVLVNRAEEIGAAAGADTRGPLYVGRTLLYPNLGEPIAQSSSRELTFYFALYGSVQDARGHAQLLQNGRALAEGPLELPTVEGPRIQHVGRLPIGTLPPGTYELRIRVTDGRRELSRTAFFTLKD